MFYFTSDLHFHHKNMILRYGRTSFSSVEEMNETIIKNINSTVKESDALFILGDIGFGPKLGTYDCLLKINCKHLHLILGNHDERVHDKNFPDIGSRFETITNTNTLRLPGKPEIFMFHYPVLEWPGYYRKAIHLYGHVHDIWTKNPEHASKLELLGNRAINVGVDVNNYFPLSINSILERFDDSV